MSLSRITRLALAAGLCTVVGGSALAQNPVPVGMPFTGYWDRYGYSPPATHPVYHGWTGTEWSTDLYAAPGTTVTFYATSSPASKGKVKSVTAVPNCTNSQGQPVDAGKYVAVDVINGSNVTLGTVVYVHLDAVSVTAGQTINSGTALGKLKLWSPSNCWTPTTNAGVHAHFEMGTAGTGFSCWVSRAAGTSVSAGTSIGKIGNTGRTTKGACP